ncbi:MAG: hypothetical protein OEY93_12000, partial [Anaerolineae bacterium]|nr:hypothetical protein [Anaerolineae bacterium]
EIGKERIQALKDSAHFAIYTPGSDAGIPVSILASLKAPEMAWKGNEEVLREDIAATVTAILGLAGMKDIDRVRSREHILLANIFEQAWSQGSDLDLGELILQTQTPPFEKLGVFTLDTFFPEKDRFELAMTLNNILAAPTFQTWITGQPLDIPSLLYGPDGKPRHSVFYIAHLNDEERMFFVTLLYAAVETWMRAQKGSTSLRALMYFDEIYGYLPPVANPPSKTSMLRMLKQGRAFGVGQILVTQNPVDIDYKGLSNTGTWLVGKLQTDQDKERLLDGLEGAASGNMNRKTYDKMISGLDKRQFLLHNVHDKTPGVFYTRWAMNYLAGPLTRTQIPALNELAGAAMDARETAAKTRSSAAAAAKTPKKSGSAAAVKGSATRQSVPAGIAEYFLPNNLTLSEAYKHAGQTPPAGAKSKGVLYRPVLLAQADIRYLQLKYDLNTIETRTALIADPDRRGIIQWDDYLAEAVDPASLDRVPAPEAVFDALEAPLSDGKILKSLESQFADWLYSKAVIRVLASEPLKLYGAPPVTEGEFRKQVSEAARKMLEADKKEVEKKFKTKISTLQKKLAKEKREKEEDEEELRQRKFEELGTHAENILGLFTGSRSSRRLSTSLSKRRMTSKAKSDVEESEGMIMDLEADLAELADEIEDAIDAVEEKWELAASEIDEIPVQPFKKDIMVNLFGVAWMPYHLVEAGGQETALPGYKA